MDNLIEATDIKLADLLRRGCFKVPQHQRYYDWDERQVDDLLNDLYDAVTQNKPCYFLGSIMLIKNGKPNQFEINDGQQRIITFSMICAYFCRRLREQGDSWGESSSLRVLFDLPEGHGETLENAESISPRVIPPRNDKINFNKLICGHDVGRNGKMTSAWNNISSFFAGKDAFLLKQQKAMLEFMLNKIIVIRLEVDNSLDVNAIYETLNSRGKNLDDVDLIKNYFLSFFANDPNSTRYDGIYEKFEKISSAIPGHAIAGYVRCHMQVQYGFIRKEQFFRETKKILGSPTGKNSNQVFRLVDSLAESSSLQIFKILSSKSESKDFLEQLTRDARKGRKRRKIDSYLLDLHDYTIARPILFALLLYYFHSSDSDKKQSALFVYGCAKLLSSFVQRVSHVSSSFKPSTYEERFVELAKEIKDGKCNTAKMFFDKLQLIDNLMITNDRQYINLMDSKFYGKNSLRKSGYILRKIVEFQEKGIAIAEDRISIEHILPKSPEHYTKKEWAEKFTPADCEKWIHCLGNLTLLSEQENSSADEYNESFSVKKPIYAGSSFQLTKDICDYDEWTPENIKRRQHKLLKIAAKQIWNFEF